MTLSRDWNSPYHTYTFFIISNSFIRLNNEYFSYTFVYFSTVLAIFHCPNNYYICTYLIETLAHVMMMFCTTFVNSSIYTFVFSFSYQLSFNRNKESFIGKLYKVFLHILKIYKVVSTNILKQ